MTLCLNSSKEFTDDINYLGAKVQVLQLELVILKKDKSILERDVVTTTYETNTLTSQIATLKEKIKHNANDQTFVANLAHLDGLVHLVFLATLVL